MQGWGGGGSESLTRSCLYASALVVSERFLLEGERTAMVLRIKPPKFGPFAWIWAVSYPMEALFSDTSALRVRSR